MPDVLIHDWNRDAAAPPPAVRLVDETLRDGLQSPSVRIPSIAEKLRILHLLDRAGIDAVNLGLPGSGGRVARDVDRLAREIADAGLRVGAQCAARTVIRDITPVVDLVQRTGVPIECGCFIGSSAARRQAEGWTLDDARRLTAEAVGFAARQGLAVMFVAEDATRAEPDTLRGLFTTAIRAGATRLCLADTAGHATPAGTRAIVRFARGVIADVGTPVEVDWHGHRDRDLGTINALTALEAGASRVHGTVLGIGERVGNTATELLLLNLVLMGWLTRDLAPLDELVQAVSAATGHPVPRNHPGFGRDAFRTATGVHAAPVAKAFRRQAPALAALLASAVPASLVGRAPEIAIGPMSGRSNVVFWLERHGLAADAGLVERLLERAKASATVLTDREIREVVAASADAAVGHA